MAVSVNAIDAARTSSPQPDGTFPSVMRTFDATADLIAALEVLAEALCGPSPASAGESKRPEVSGRLHVLSERAHSVTSMVKQGFEALERIKMAID